MQSQGITCRSIFHMSFLSVVLLGQTGKPASSYATPSCRATWWSESEGRSSTFSCDMAIYLVTVRYQCVLAGSCDSLRQGTEICANPEV